MFKKINKRHLLALSALFVVLSIIGITSKASAYFTASTTTKTTGKTAKLDVIESEKLMLSNKNLFNPGDYDLEKDENARPGTDHDLTFSLKNNGNVGALTRNIVTISVDPESNLDASMFYLVEPGSEGNGVAQGPLVRDHKIFYSDNYEMNKNNTFSDTKDNLEKITAVRYIIEGDIIGAPNNSEDIASEKSYAYGVALSKDAGNKYANSSVNVEVKVQAVQDANVSGDLLDPNSQEWEIIFTGQQ